MTEFALLLFVLILLVVVGQAWLVLGFVRILKKERPALLPDEQAPKAAVVLCLRGGDPFLADCLRGLLCQDYPKYDVRIVIDHANDPAREVAERVVRECEASGGVTIEILEARRATCSLKCSSLLQVVNSLDDSYEFVAQLDADTIAHATWLRELATALADEHVGAATGNRWYMPGNPTVGALVRYTWNAAAVVQMVWYRVAWGGTLAIKTRVFRETDVLEKWGYALCEDTMLYGVLKKIGKRVAFVPSLMMTNREDCDLGGFFRWVRRQLLTARLYHPAWSAVLGHGIVTTLAPAAALLVSIAAMIRGNLQAAAWAAAAVGLYEVSVAALLVPMEQAVRRIVRARGEHSNWLPFKGQLKCLAIMPITQVVYAMALAAAVVARCVVWRDITYRVEGPWLVRLEHDQPYQPRNEDEQTVSL